MDYDIIDNIRKAQTTIFYKIALYRSSKFDKTQFLRITHRLIWKQTGDRDEAKENSGGRFGKF